MHWKLLHILTNLPLNNIVSGNPSDKNTEVRERLGKVCLVYGSVSQHLFHWKLNLFPIQNHKDWIILLSMPPRSHPRMSL